LLAIGNSKTGVASWSIPPVATCPPGVKCAECQPGKKTPGCYVFNYWHRPTIRWQYWQNLVHSLLPGFGSRLAMDARRSGAKVVRLHVSGDMYSLEYAKEIKFAAQLTPEITWYAYTKWTHILGRRPANLVINWSADFGERCGAVPKGLDADNATMVIGKDEPRPKGARLCPAQLKDGMTCEQCGWCQKKGGAVIAFREH